MAAGLVAMRGRAVQMLMEQSKQGAVAMAEVERANVELGEAKIRLLDRQRSISTAAGSESLSAWNRELINRQRVGSRC